MRLLAIENALGRLPGGTDVPIRSFAARDEDKLERQIRAIRAAIDARSSRWAFLCRWAGYLEAKLASLRSPNLTKEQKLAEQQRLQREILRLLRARDRALGCAVEELRGRWAWWSEQVSGLEAFREPDPRLLELLELIAEFHASGDDPQRQAELQAEIQRRTAELEQDGIDVLEFFGFHDPAVSHGGGTTTALRGLGAVTNNASYVRVQVYDRTGSPFPDVAIRIDTNPYSTDDAPVFASTDGSGYAIITLEGIPQGRKVRVDVDLPEGTWTAFMETGDALSPVLEVHSTMTKPEPFLTLGEGLTAGGGIFVSVLGSLLENSILTGIGTSMVVSAGFSTFFRHFGVSRPIPGL